MPIYIGVPGRIHGTISAESKGGKVLTFDDLASEIRLLLAEQGKPVTDDLVPMGDLDEIKVHLMRGDVLSLHVKGPRWDCGVPIKRIFIELWDPPEVQK